MKPRSRGIRIDREKVGVTATRNLRLPCADSRPGKRSRMAMPSRTCARYSLPSVVSEKSARPNSLVPMICSSWRTRWLTALGVTQSSSAASVAERSRANASNVSKHWIGGILAVIGPGDVLLDDRAFVQIRCHIVGRGADQLHTAVVRLVVRLGALEAGQ